MAYTRFVNPRRCVFRTRTGRVIEPRQKVPVPPGITLSASSFKASRLAVSAAAELDLNFGTASTEADASFFLLQFAFHDPDLYVTEYAGEEVGQLFGSALRIGVLTTGTKASASMNLGMIAASATVNEMSTVLEVDTIGMNHDLSTKITNLISSKTFDATAMTEIGQAIGEFQFSVKEDPSLLEPDLIEYGDLISSTGANYFAAVSAAYALHSVTKERDLQDALDRLSNKLNKNDTDYYYPLVNPIQTEAVYYQVSNGNPWGKVSSETKKRAKKIYDNTKAD